jgi:RNA polymerase sigma factor (sigma-70 family)
MEKLNEIKHGQYKLEKLIDVFKPYLITMASNFTINQSIKDDLLAEAYVSIWNSNTNYDSQRGATFFTYIIQQARYSMLRFLNEKQTTNQTIYTPPKQKEKYNITTISMDSTINDYQAIYDTIIDEVEEDTEEDKILHLRAYMKDIKKTHRDILEIKYQGHSDTELAEMTGLTKQRIGQIVQSSIKILQTDFGVAAVGTKSKKHTGLKKKEKELMKKHNLL